MNNNEFICNFIAKYNNNESSCLKHMSFVYSVAKTYKNKYPRIDFIDLFQSGLYGLIVSEKHYNKSSGNKFLSYAVQGVRSHINKFICECGFEFSIYSTLLSKICTEYNDNGFKERVDKKYYDDIAGKLWDRQFYDNRNQYIVDESNDINKTIEKKDLLNIINVVVNNMSEVNQRLYSMGIYFDNSRFMKYKIAVKTRQSLQRKFRIEFLKILKREFKITRFNDIAEYFDE